MVYSYGAVKCWWARDLSQDKTSACGSDERGFESHRARFFIQTGQYPPFD